MSVGLLRSPATIRERCANILAAVESGASPHWIVDRVRLDDAAAEVAQVLRARHPSLAVPYHGVWRLFEASGVDRPAELAARLAERDPVGAARARIDLATVAVLLGADAAAAAADWRFVEDGTGRAFSNAEGLAIAAFHGFAAGAFSARGDDPLRVDAARLQALDADALGALLQVRADNPLPALAERVLLLRRFGEAFGGDCERFGADGRPGALFDYVATGLRVRAASVLRALLDGLAPVWPGEGHFNGRPLGDVWPHPLAGGEGASAGWVPLHALAQRLAYSLLEPLEWAGIAVDGIDALTAPADHRHGGLLIDTGVVRARDRALPRRPLAPGDEPVVEWRALTVALVDALAPLVRERLDRRPPQLPLVSLLEGTAAAGRLLALRLRGGPPPLRIVRAGPLI